MKKLNQTFQVIFTPEEEGGFTVTVPALPGCISYGKDLTEARAMIVDAIQGYLTTLKKYDPDFEQPPIPLKSDIFVGSVTV